QRRSVAASRSNHADPTLNKLGCQRRQTVVATLRPAILDPDVLALDIASLLQALPECRNDMRIALRCGRIEEADNWHILLRARRERPRCRRAAQKRDELAPPHTFPARQPVSYRLKQLP